ncbi:hypothetical protein ACFWBM_23110 [Streptomyces sp. NPDC059980]|uniref:hypothetical protein n=1 Tax=Streptomyces sp. NPDC059980 TaxID=3347022 RepID=UPI0036979CFD
MQLENHPLAETAEGLEEREAMRHQLRAAMLLRSQIDAPEVGETRLDTAHHDDLAVVTVRKSPQTALSSVSAAWLQADMIGQLRLKPGTTVLEVGSGGYNAELLAHALSERGNEAAVRGGRQCSARPVLQWPGRTLADALSIPTAGGQRA